MTLMSQGLMSASEIGLPRPGLSPASAGAEIASAMSAAPARTLDIDMFDLPAAVDRPCGQAVIVLVGEAEHVGHFLSLATHGNEIGAQRLHRAGIVPSSAGQRRRLTIP